MAGLDELDAGSDVEVPDTVGIWDHLVAAEDGPNFDYSVGIFTCEEIGRKVQVIGVIEIDSLVLVAVPDGAWHRQRSRRVLPADALQRPTRVVVRCASNADRSVPEESAEARLWLGILKGELEDSIVFGVDEATDVNFPVDTVGLPLLPFSEALLAVANDHFLFKSAESGQNRDPNMEQRLAGLEENLARVLARLGQPSQRQATVRSPALPFAASQPCSYSLGTPSKSSCGGTAWTGSSHCSASSCGRGVPAGVAGTWQRDCTHRCSSSSRTCPGRSDGDFRRRRGRRAVGRRIWVAGSLARSGGQLELHCLRDETKEACEKRQDPRGHFLDRADGGSVKDTPSSSRSKSAALRSLQRLLESDPRLIYRSIEAHMQEDWEMGGQRLPGSDQPDIGSRMARASEPHFQLPRHQSTCLDAGGHLGFPHQQPSRRSQVSCSSGNGLLRSDGMRQGRMAHVERADVGTSTTVLFVRKAHSARPVGEPDHEVGGRPVDGSHYEQVEGLVGLPGEK